MRRFESYRPCQKSVEKQAGGLLSCRSLQRVGSSAVEQSPFKRKCVGSNPTRPTKPIRTMHSKRKGAVAELHVACFLTQKGYAVFTEMGDLSRTDLVVDIDGVLIRVQVKYITRVDGCYKFTTAKSGPNYRFLYTVSDVDVFALYCADGSRLSVGSTLACAPHNFNGTLPISTSCVMAA